LRSRHFAIGSLHCVFDQEVCVYFSLTAWIGQETTGHGAMIQRPALSAAIADASGKAS